MKLNNNEYPQNNEEEMLMNVNDINRENFD